MYLVYMKFLEFFFINLLRYELSVCLTKNSSYQFVVFYFVVELNFEVVSAATQKKVFFEIPCSTDQQKIYRAIARKIFLKFKLKSFWKKLDATQLNNFVKYQLASCGQESQIPGKETIIREKETGAFLLLRLWSDYQNDFRKNFLKKYYFNSYMQEEGNHALWC